MSLQKTRKFPTFKTTVDGNSVRTLGFSRYFSVSAKIFKLIEIVDENQLNYLPDNFRLMPGMTATAEIKVGRRKVIEYFLYPLLRYMDRSIREPT